MKTSIMKRTISDGSTNLVIRKRHRRFSLLLLACLRPKQIHSPLTKLLGRLLFLLERLPNLTLCRPRLCLVSLTWLVTKKTSSRSSSTTSKN